MKSQASWQGIMILQNNESMFMIQPIVDLSSNKVAWWLFIIG